MIRPGLEPRTACGTIPRMLDRSDNQQIDRIDILPLNDVPLGEHSQILLITVSNLWKDSRKVIQVGLGEHISSPNFNLPVQLTEPSVLKWQRFVTTVKWQRFVLTVSQGISAVHALTQELSSVQRVVQRPIVIEFRRDRIACCQQKHGTGLVKTPLAH